MSTQYGNVEGKAYAINVITPIKPWTRLIQKLVFLYVTCFPGSTKRLVDLSFIHFARWVVVRKCQFPHLGNGQPREKLKYDYLLFYSNFNGTWSQYIDAFSNVLPGGLNGIWNWSVKFPGSRPGQKFKSYIRFNQVDTSHYYVAYPGATVNDVKAAKQLSGAVLQFETMTAGLSDSEFLTAYNKLLLAVQKNIGGTGGPGPAPASD